MWQLNFSLCQETDVGGVREERFEGLVYHQGASIR
jgi:hypothetical protein